jgi:FkbM family methyltransferase
MKYMIILLLRPFLNFCFRANPRLINRLTYELNLSQGKGFGDSTTEIEAKLSLELLRQNLVFDPIVFDIGANIGNYTNSILKLNSSAKIYAFEPSKVAREILEKRFLYVSSVEIIPYALGGKNTMGTLWSDILGSGLGSLQKRQLEHFGINFSKSEQVEIVTVDSWCAENAIYPHMIKIDVEGSEFEILLGSTKTLEHVTIVQFEFGGANIDSRTFFQDFWYLFAKLNFKIFRITKNGLVHISKYSEEDEFFKTTNYIALKAKDSNTQR